MRGQAARSPGARRSREALVARLMNVNSRTAFPAPPQSTRTPSKIGRPARLSGSSLAVQRILLTRTRVTQVSLAEILRSASLIASVRTQDRPSAQQCRI